LDTTLVGSHALSAGEAQLLAFARVLLKNPCIVILDEATSRLDPVTESLIERAVARLLEGRTAILIAHRLHTLTRTDKILLLEQGRVVEVGPYAELAQNPDSRFADLLRSGALAEERSDEKAEELAR
jgi:ABC-type multidrug transport system fused ATPase/permease subunit